MQAIAIIPARYGSQRLPGKALLDQTGTPLVVHVARRAAAARSISSVIIATDDQRIIHAAEAHGQTAVITRADHPNGTSRLAEVAAGLPQGFDIVVNVQGDEPEIDPALIDRVVQRLRDGREPMATLVGPITDPAELADPNVVKVVINQRGQAMYFSRAPIPYDRDGLEPASTAGALKHAGLYAYRREFLPIYVRLSATPAEQREKLEQLRALEHGHSIATVIAPFDHVGIDTAEQYQAFVERWGQGVAGDRR